MPRNDTWSSSSGASRSRIFRRRVRGRLLLRVVELGCIGDGTGSEKEEYDATEWRVGVYMRVEDWRTRQRRARDKIGGIWNKIEHDDQQQCHNKEANPSHITISPNGKKEKTAKLTSSPNSLLNTLYHPFIA